MKVTLQHVSKAFGATPVLRDISLEVAPHELFFLLDPSGCGKTTLLRLVAGFYQPDTGEVWLGEHCMNGVPPHRRNTGMVFQNYALWPHLTVAENVGYGLEVRRVPRPERARRFDAAERAAWGDWPGPRLTPQRTVGTAFNAGAAWQVVAACDALQRGLAPVATVSVVGTHQQTIGARFVAAGAGETGAAP